MRLRRWLYVVAGIGMVVVIGLVAYDQLVVGPDGDGTYLLGKATPALVWILTLVTPLALIDFFVWLRRTRGHTSGFWWPAGLVAAAFLIGFLASRDWNLVWIVEGDIEVSFGSDEFLSVVTGLWFAALAALLLWIGLREPATESLTTEVGSA